MSPPIVLGAYFHTLSPYVWRISGDFGVRWYGLAYACGFLLGWLALRLHGSIVAVSVRRCHLAR